MSTVQKIVRNTGILMGGDLLFRLISLIVTVYLARYLGTVGFGKYSFVFAYLAFFGVITDLGIQTILVREMSRDPLSAPKLFGNAYIIRLLLTIPAVILSMIIINMMLYPAEIVTYVYIAAFTVFFISFSDFYSTIFLANLRSEYNTIAKLTFKILSASLIFWIIFSNGTLMQVIIALVISEMVRTVINFSFSRKFVKPLFSLDLGQWKYLFNESLPLALFSITYIIYWRIDVVMLSMMQGDAPVGIYAAAYKLSEPLNLIPGALATSLFPIMSAFFKTSKARLINTFTLGEKYVLILTLPIATGITLLADKFILLIYGYEFANSTMALQILIWSLVFSSGSYILIDLLVSIEKQKLNTFSLAVSTVINIALNSLLIPILSYNGASIATVISSAVVFILSFYFVSKHLQVLPLHKLLVKPAISGLVMGIFIYYFIESSIFLLVPLAGIVYLGTLLSLKTFSDEEWTIFKSIVRNLPGMRNRY
jgi:O-antigen/teichoic acid export membrane protein